MSLKAAMRFPLLLKTLLLSAICSLGGLLFGQTSPEGLASATITFANGESVTIGSNSQEIFNPVEVRPGEALGIELHLPPGFVNTPVGMQPMDGGFAPEEIEIAQDGSTAFVFYRIQLRTLDSLVLLQFSVPNPGNP